MKLLYGVLALAFIAFLFAAYSVTHAQQNAKDRRIELCVQENVIKTILRKEHTIRLHRAQVFLKKHPHGTKDFSRQDILNGISDEQDIISSVQPIECK